MVTMISFVISSANKISVSFYYVDLLSWWVLQIASHCKSTWSAVQRQAQRSEKLHSVLNQLRHFGMHLLQSDRQVVACLKTHMCAPH